MGHGNLQVSWVVCLNFSPAVLSKLFRFFQVLSPRTDISQYQSGRHRRRKREDRESTANAEGKCDETRDPAAIVSSFE